MTDRTDKDSSPEKRDELPPARKTRVLNMFKKSIKSFDRQLNRIWKDQDSAISSSIFLVKEEGDLFKSKRKLLRRTAEYNAVFTICSTQRSFNTLENAAKTFALLGLNIQATTGIPLHTYNRLDSYQVSGSKEHLEYLAQYFAKRGMKKCASLDKREMSPSHLKCYYISAEIENHEGLLEQFCKPLNRALLQSHQCLAKDDGSGMSSLLIKIKASEDDLVEKAINEIDAIKGINILSWGLVTTKELV